MEVAREEEEDEDGFRAEQQKISDERKISSQVSNLSRTKRFRLLKQLC